MTTRSEADHPRVPVAPGRGLGLGKMIAGAVAATAIAAAVLLSTASPASAKTIEFVFLHPDHGQATAPFTAIYEVYPTPTDCETGTQVVDFYWDNVRQNNGAQMKLVGTTCRAYMEITPPVDNNGVGIHEVRGDRHPYVGPVTVYGRSRASYRIDPVPSESPAAAPGASPRQPRAVGGGVPVGNGSPPTSRAPAQALEASPNTPASPGPGFAIGIPAAQTSSAASGSGRHARGANGSRIGLVGGAVAAAAVAWVIAVAVKRRRWSATQV